MPSRGLTSGEIALAKTIFGSELDYSVIRVNFDTQFLPTDRAHVVLPNSIFFPKGYNGAVDFSLQDIYAQSTFIHELTHVYQIKQLGIVAYAARHLEERLQLGDAGAYKYGSIFEQNVPFSQLSLEAQAQFIGEYYILTRGFVGNLAGERQQAIEIYQAYLPKELQDAVDSLPEGADNPVEIPLRRCFAAGTVISTPEGPRAIETIRAGDMVFAFSEHHALDGQDLSIASVARSFRTEGAEIIAFNGVMCTPDHAFLNGRGGFSPLRDILAADGLIVREDGVTVRARTNQPIGNEEDQVISVVLDAGEVIKLRAGAPYGRLTFDGPVYTLSAKMAHEGYRLREDGLFVNDAGDVRMATWEWGDPRDHPIAKDYVVGEPYELAEAALN